ncbi:MAG: hypothetical protein M1833_002855 [Piccolia ochrophora]|nr:MAG: hypothetical protein M1833_002855 [Piccolia ochrophora]
MWFTSYRPFGKTAVDSRFNLPGKLAWMTMEIPGSITLLYIMFSLPCEGGIKTPLPWANWLMAGMFVFHYMYRAVLAPLVLNPTMSPMHPIAWVAAFCWQVANATSIGGWLAGYGPRTVEDWAGKYGWIEFGMMVWALGLMANIYHDDELREIRRAAARRQNRRGEAQGDSTKETKKVDKVYEVPQNGLFRAILYPHYLCEWIEWAGFWMVGGSGCLPARSFLFNEIASMAPQAVWGRRWYLQRFGAEKIGARKAIIPGVL